MKYIVLLALMLVSASAFSQSEQAEFEALKKSTASNFYEVGSFQDTLLKWQKNLKKFGAYPDLPLNEAGAVHYAYELSFETQSQAELFRHSKEWIALNLALYGDQYYSCEANGKIIYATSFGTGTQYDCNYTAVLTIRDNKILIEFIRLSYENFTPGHYSGENWVGDNTVRRPIESLYPVCRLNSGEWQTVLKLFKSTNDNISQLVNDLSAHLQNYKVNNDI